MVAKRAGRNVRCDGDDESQPIAVTTNGGRWMRLTPREQEAMFIYVAAGIARQRRERGLRLNYPEAVALISEAMLEAARDGRSVTEAAEIGAQVLEVDDVMEGIPEMVTLVQVEATFPDGTKLVSCHHPIQ